VQRPKILFLGGLCKDVFNRLRNHKNAHALWSDICALHEEIKSEREERYHIDMRKLNSFEMLANDMYSWLNILVEEVNGLGLTQISQPDVVRKILSVLPIEKHGHIVIVPHQMDLSTATPTQILGKINAHKLYMHINNKDGSFSKKKDLALKANQEKKVKTKILVEEETSSDDDLDINIALMVKKTTKMLKKLNQEDIKLIQERSSSLESRESSSRKWIAIIVESLVIFLINAQSPRRTNLRARKMMKVKIRRKKRSFSRKRMANKKNSTKRKGGKAYIVGDWLTDIESTSDSFSSEEDDEKVTTFAFIHYTHIPYV
jgi:hypothetical protein